MTKTAFRSACALLAVAALAGCTFSVTAPTTDEAGKKTPATVKVESAPAVTDIDSPEYKATAKEIFDAYAKVEIPGFKAGSVSSRDDTKGEYSQSFSPIDPTTALSSAYLSISPCNESCVNMDAVEFERLYKDDYVTSIGPVTLDDTSAYYYLRETLYNEEPTARFFVFYRHGAYRVEVTFGEDFNMLGATLKPEDFNAQGWELVENIIKAVKAGK